MDKDTVLNIAKQIHGKTNVRNFFAHRAELLNLIQTYAGKGNAFYIATEKLNINATFADEYLDNIITSFVRSVEHNIISKVSFERKIKIGVVNDYLVQAEQLLEQEEFHPAIATVLIGASLEEFLRNWVMEENIDYGTKATIDSYAKALRTKNLITKQDHKDITAWTGYRNHAAHGHWDLADNREKIRMILAGISLFIKQYSI